MFARGEGQVGAIRKKNVHEARQEVRWLGQQAMGGSWWWWQGPVGLAGFTVCKYRRMRPRGGVVIVFKQTFPIGLRGRSRSKWGARYRSGAVEHGGVYEYLKGAFYNMEVLCVNELLDPHMLGVDALNTAIIRIIWVDVRAMLVNAFQICCTSRVALWGCGL